jgi:N-acetylglucosaminyldiphosphoundecaprenol N-acetyl-beta-D-mannosaminyltransferase
MRVGLMGLEIDAVTADELISRILGGLDAGQGGWVLTANLEILRQFERSAALRALLRPADIFVVDGMPLVWAARLQGTPVPGRVAGSDLVPALSAAAAQAGRSVYLLGGLPEAREGAELELRRRAPALRVAGSYSPPFGFEHVREELERIRNDLRAARPDIVFVAFSFPKGDRLIAWLRDDFPATWFIGVGIAFSFLAGDVRRAPKWMSRVGLEWLHRLWQEPRRLGRRYLVDGIPFALMLFADALLARLGRRDRLHVRA